MMCYVVHKDDCGYVFALTPTAVLCVKEPANPMTFSSFSGACALLQLCTMLDDEGRFTVEVRDAD